MLSYLFRRKVVRIFSLLLLVDSRELPEKRALAVLISSEQGL
jgi:hypothetical protein